jgi:Galactose oxidase, central domain
MREKGWYLFGGINSDDSTISNDLWILRLGRKPLEWIRPNTRGKPPQPRYSHSLNYYEEGNFLILHGGRNDLTSQSFALNDTHIFDLSKMEWQEIKLFSDGENFSVFNRCGHSGIVFSKQSFNY